MSERITGALRDMVDAAPTPPPFPQENRPVRTTTRTAAIAVPVAAALLGAFVLMRAPSPDDPPTPSSFGTGEVAVRHDPATIDVGDADARLVLDDGEVVDLDLRDSGPRSDGVWSATFGGTATERLSFSIADIRALEKTPTPSSDDLRVTLRLGTEVWTSSAGECTVEVGNVRGADGYGLLFECDEPIGPGLAGVALPFNGG